MYWLAINREPISFQELTADLVTTVSPSEIIQAIASLQRRSLIEKSETLESVLSVVFSSNGQLLATGDVNGQIRLWQMPIGKAVLTIEKHYYL